MKITDLPMTETRRKPAARTWTIAELAREYAVTPRAIRYYEDEGLLSPGRQGTSRIYSGGDKSRLGWILRGRRLGFTLGETRELLSLYNADRSGVQQLRALVRKSRDHIGELEAKLRDLQAQIAEFRNVESEALSGLRLRGIEPDEPSFDMALNR